MTEPSNPRRPKHGTWAPQPETLALLRASGNTINGVRYAHFDLPQKVYHLIGRIPLSRHTSSFCEGPGENCTKSEVSLSA